MVILSTDIKFKRNEDTHKTLLRVILELNGMLLEEVIRVEELVGKLTIGVENDPNWVKSVESKVIWSVASLSKI